jgi:rare lipoprotein A
MMAKGTLRAMPMPNVPQPPVSSRRARSLAGLALGALLVAGCGGGSAHVRAAVAVDAAHVERGDASWYGGAFAGRTTASGEVFDPEGFTAAHRTLAFGTWVRVVRADTRQWVVVRINDRGPFVRGRIVDLSEAAARDLGMLERGVVEVTLEVMPDPAPLAATASREGGTR